MKLKLPLNFETLEIYRHWLHFCCTNPKRWQDMAFRGSWTLNSVFGVRNSSAVLWRSTVSLYKGEVFPVHQQSTMPWRRIGEMEVQLHALLTSALVEGEWSAWHPGQFIPRERAPGTHWIGGWVGSRTSLGHWWNKKYSVPTRTGTHDHQALYHWAILAPC
jgi:hypothetical protein